KHRPPDETSCALTGVASGVAAAPTFGPLPLITILLFPGPPKRRLARPMPPAVVSGSRLRIHPLLVPVHPTPVGITFSLASELPPKTHSEYSVLMPGWP